MPKKLTDSGTQPFETMTLAEGRLELTAPRSKYGSLAD